MTQYLISILIFTPLVAALVALFIPASSRNLFRVIALGASIIQVVAVMFIATSYNSSERALQFVELKPWISLDLGSWGVLQANYFVALDGLSFPLVALSVSIMLIAVISSWNVSEKVKGYFILFLILNAAVIGTFTSFDFLLFYLFFEFMLLPMFFLIGIWGGKRREYASVKFFLYTLFGSIFILMVMIGLYISVDDPSSGGALTHTFNLLVMSDQTHFVSGSIFDPMNPTVIGSWNARAIGFLMLLIGFIIKLPSVPLHTWLPDAHVEASTPVSVILAALLLKIGGYGLLRIAYPIFPEAATQFAVLVATLGVVSIIYGALNALASKDLKRLIAYSSVSHMGFVLLGLASLTPEGISGAAFQMISHGILSAMLFLLAGVLYDRTHDRMIGNYSGLASKMPIYFTFTLIAFFASLGLPGFSGFIGEIMILLGAFKSSNVNQLIPIAFAVVATIGLVLGAAYFLWAIQRMFFGRFHVKGNIAEDSLKDLTTREYAMLLMLGASTFFLGIMPQPLIEIINPFATAFTELVLTHARNVSLIP